MIFQVEEGLQKAFNQFAYYKANACLTLRRPKQHRSQAPDVPDLAQTVKPWSDLFKIFTNVFAGT